MISDCVITMENGLLINNNKPTDSTDSRPRREKPARYSIRLEYSSPGGTRTSVSRPRSVSDEGGFDLKLPPNRFRTRSIAIVAGYSPERVYSNMPPGAFVVESGVYKVGADRDYVKSEPIYWKQVVYGSRAGSDGSGTIPRNPASAPGVQILHGPRLVADGNLQLQGGPSLRASSPLDQGKPLVDWLSPANNYSDISSVPHPGSADRSFPTTLLTNPLSSISSPNFSIPSTLSPEQTQSSGSRTTRGRTISSLHTIPEDSRLSVTADIHHSTGRERYYSTQYAHYINQYSQYSNLAEYSSGVGGEGPETPRSSHVKQQASFDQSNFPGGEWAVSRDISFPGHQIGLPYYPAPVHRAISPSTQYPPPPTASHIQPPRIPDIRVGQVDPKEVDIYQRIAKLDPENANSENTRPLATSSPPGKRKRESESNSDNTSITDENDKYKPRFPTPPSDVAGGVRAGPQAPRSRKTSQKLRESRLQTLRELSEADSASSRGGGEGEERREYDLISVVSEGLDAEVTAITSSSSPESSGTNTLQQPTDRAVAAADNTTTSSTSGIASKSSSSSQNQTSSSALSTSGGSFSILQQSNSLNQSLDLSKLQQQTILAPVLDPKELLEEVDGMPFYENWPPRPYQYSPALRMKPAEYLAYQIQQQQQEQSLPPTMTTGVPPFTPHLGRYRARPGRTGSSPDTSTETPPSRFGSRPNSSQSAPLDRSVDRHYEWDSVIANDDSVLAPLPPEWTVRRSPAYNPRRDRDIGPMVSANRDRVFSDSEIYSNVFPRRPGLQIDVEARVRAMKKEFKEYRKTMNKSPATDEPDRLESLI